MSYRARKLPFPAANHARDDRLGEIRLELVIAARLDVKYGGFCPCIIGERKSEFGRSVMDINILAAGNGGRGAPPGHTQVRGNRRSEIAGIGK